MLGKEVEAPRWRCPGRTLIYGVPSKDQKARELVLWVLAAPPQL